MTSKDTLLRSIQTGLSKALGNINTLQWGRDLHGGDINQAALIHNKDTSWFVKYRNNAPRGMFEAEARALQEIAACQCIRVPQAIAWGEDNGTSWLVLEYLELTSTGPVSLLGEQLAAMHDISHEHFGWAQDNYIGTTPQLNRRSDNWIEFWRDCRMQPQLSMASTAGFNGRLFERGQYLLTKLDQLLQDHKPTASLLHGDLWSGNKAFTTTGQPVIFDPASYYGDRETDIAMTELFGGFEPAFYSAYRAHSPLPAGYPLRRDLYKLYHMLNHLNLFGAAYLSSCENIIDGLLAEIT